MFHLARIAMTVLTWMFLLGVCGSLLVVAISFLDDLHVLVSKD